MAAANQRGPGGYEVYTVDDKNNPLRGIDIRHVGSFTLTLSDGAGQVFRIRSDGQCDSRFLEEAPETQPHDRGASQWRWRDVQFTVDPKTITDLRQPLHDIDFVRLKREYYGDSCDGIPRRVTLDVGGNQKGVYCSRHLPKGFERLYRFAYEKIIYPHEKDWQTAPAESAEGALLK